MTSIHLAACAGHVKVLKQFVLYCPDSFELVDHKGRNALHLAIINNKNEVEEFVRKDSWLSSVLLNGKDSIGNTPLHQIAISEAYEATGVTGFINDERVDKMAVNQNGMNAVDIIVRKHRREQEGIDIFLQTNTYEWLRNMFQGLKMSGAIPGQRLMREFTDGSGIHLKKRDPELIYKEIREFHLLVSAIIATVTFAAGFTVPGGFQSEKGPDQGFAVLSRNAAFKAFVITNTLAMTTSSCAVAIRFFLSLKGKHLGSKAFDRALDLTSFALLAMVAAFLAGTYAVLGGHSSLGLAIGVCGIGCYYFVSGIAFVSPGFQKSRVRRPRIDIIRWLGLEYYFRY